MAKAPICVGSHRVRFRAPLPRDQSQGLLDASARSARPRRSHAPTGNVQTSIPFVVHFGMRASLRPLSATRFNYDTQPCLSLNAVQYT